PKSLFEPRGVVVTLMLLLTVAVAGFGFAMQARAEEAGGEGTAVRIKPKYARYGLGQSIEIVVNLRNISDVSWDWRGDTWMDALGISVVPAVTASGGSSEPAPAAMVRRRVEPFLGAGVQAPRIQLRPGESGEYTVNLSRYIRFGKMGRYRVALSFTGEGGSVRLQAECGVEIIDTMNEEFETDLTVAWAMMSNRMTLAADRARLPRRMREKAGPLSAEAERDLADAFGLVLSSFHRSAHVMHLRIFSEEEVMMLSDQQSAFLIHEILRNGTPQQQQDMAKAITGRADYEPGKTGYGDFLLVSVCDITPARLDPCVVEILRPWYEKLCVRPSGPPIRVEAWDTDKDKAVAK
ncbi:MAG TPA: hypothetical protein VK970_10290, partial [Candidatus Methylacidiphilales bacterium]|nr:hypothetical protein [Candidatus Methylacidiphilales bacterium]